ncbi:hypothetical protein CAEBREN_04509 [Caenorhabditis brenneri]|uniref:Uncharacterized protein n=1 Tax=Caenorhabditis brenneri TaxID=135651 RepID=G0M7P3_CAEBE|nr:hypothetical protein CAEBREN_04509 [Caenorhabditis brenneri]
MIVGSWEKMKKKKEKVGECKKDASEQIPGCILTEFTEKDRKRSGVGRTRRVCGLQTRSRYGWLNWIEWHFSGQKNGSTLFRKDWRSISEWTLPHFAIRLSFLQATVNRKGKRGKD